MHIYGKELLRDRARERALVSENLSAASDGFVKMEAFAKHSVEIKQAEMWGMFLVTTGGGLGLLAFGPICEWIGRRRAFLVFHLGGLIAALSLFQGLAWFSDSMLPWGLLVFGFWTLGMHAGYAIYFPELYPTRLRSSGADFCFNFARLATTLMLLLKGVVENKGVSFENSASLLSLLFLVGIVLLAWAPETKGTELPV